MSLTPDARYPDGRGRLLLKSVLDRSLAAVLLLVAGAWMLLIALAIRLDGPGPVLVRERRVGRGGREFWLLRFRSSVLEAPRHVGSEARGPVPARVAVATRVGRVVRGCYLDELPKLLNVLRGDLSFVGPPPLSPRSAAADRLPALPVRPGLTGLYSRGPRPGTPAAPLDVDEYLRNYSIALDLSILRRALRPGRPGTDVR
ncbi:sugar transferase [Modestobacter sp. NPDC049651]|uniref:sugar transferase n=1 Tax=unclassified Modestobacter TaxID=2643866 RepID=UPI0033D97146